MARELGLNPRKLGSLANHDQEPWKAPLPQFIARLCLERFGRDRPVVVRSIEEVARVARAKKAARREAKLRRRAAAPPLGVAWYLPEQWDRLLEVSIDRNVLEPTHAEWLSAAEGAVGRLVAAGIAVAKVVIDVAALEGWCRERARPVDAAARSEYVTERVREMIAPEGPALGKSQ